MDLRLNTFSQWTERKEALYFIICFSALLKLSITAFNDVINRDGILYIAAAQEFATGRMSEGLALFPLPLYSFMIAVIHYLIPNWVIAARFISVTSLVLTVIPLYLIANDLFDRKAAFWGSLAFALAPVLNGWALDVVRGPIFVFVFAWAVYYAQRSIKSPRMHYFVMTAIFSWLSVLFRIEGLILVSVYPLFLFCLLFWKPLERDQFLKGIFLWFMISLIILFAVLMVSGYGKQEITNLFKARFPGAYSFNQLGLDNYFRIYQKLEILENTPPYPIGKHNFFAISRHYIAIIYLFGFLEPFIKVLFPFFVLPLFWGFRQPLKKTHVFLIVSLISYLLALYYTLLMRDFISKRFFFAAAFILYPWIGMGMKRMFKLVEQSSRPKLFASIFVLVFIIAPFYKSVDAIGKHDKLISKAGGWVARQAAFNEAKILTTDLRFIFYAKRKINFPIDGSNSRSISKFVKLKDFNSVEQFALGKQMDLFITKIRLKRNNAVPKFKYYRKVKLFTGEKSIVAIYCTEELYRKLNDKAIGFE